MGAGIYNENTVHTFEQSSDSISCRLPILFPIGFKESIYSDW